MEVAMASIPGIKGVSYAPYRGGFKLRWRELHETPDGVVRRGRSFTVAKELEVAPTAVAIRKALDRQGYWTPGEVVVPVRAIQADVEAMAAEWLVRKVGRKRLARSTKQNLKGALRRFFAGVRAVEGVPDGPLLVRHLNRDVVERVVGWLAERYAPGTVYQTVHPVVCEMWPWATDHGVAGLSPAPRDTGSLLPRNAVYAPPNVLPTVAEVDAMIARITVPRARVAAVLMRGTGLRIEQVAHIHGEDFGGATLLIRKGKSRREQALMRTVAVPEWLVPLLESMGAMREGVLIRAQDRYGGVFERPMASPRNLSMHFLRAWERAEADGAVRERIWAPENRRKASTTHVLRAVYQATLEEAGVRDGVIDWLVGHAGRSTRATSYTKPSMAQMRAAVAHIPAMETEAP
jgi:hypothetical protein